MGAQEPVAITGIGMICPLGVTVRDCWEKLLDGRSGVRRISRFDTEGCSTVIGGQLPESYESFEKARTPKRLFKQTIRVTRLMRICAQDALEDSGIDKASLNPLRAAVILGTSGGSVRGPDDMGGADEQRFKVIREMLNASAAWVGIENGFRGPGYVVSGASASGAYAVIKAVELIRWGLADLVVTGGADMLLTRNSLQRGGFFQLLSRRNEDPEKASRPFDAGRDGWVLSDGGCVLILESRAHAARRDASVYAWIEGCGFRYSPYRAFSAGRFSKDLADTMEAALKESALSKGDISYVGASGTSGVMEDACETAALRTVFGRHAERLLISAHKSMIGHTVGGSGPISLGVGALAVRHGEVPPTINQEEADPACALNYVPNRMMSLSQLEGGLVNVFDPGGHHCAFALARSAGATGLPERPEV